MKKFALLCLLLVAIIFSLNSATTQNIFETTSRYRVFYAPSAHADFGGFVTIPLSEAFKRDLKTPRTSLTAGVNLSIISVQIGNLEVTSGPVFYFVNNSMKEVKGKSLIHYVDKNYYLGYGVGGIYHFNNPFDLGFGYQIGYNSILSNKNVKRIAHIFELKAGYTFNVGLTSNWDVVVPLRFYYGTDYLGVSLSIGVRWFYSKIMKAPVWLLQQQQAAKNQQ